MNVFIEFYKAHPELEKYFANENSFYTWRGKNFHPLSNPTIEQILKKAKKRKLGYVKSVKYNKDHIV